MTNEDTQAKGDNDPVDVCEIGQHVGLPGEIKKVKVLGVMALLDEGETDWKLLAIDVRDPLAKEINGKCTSIIKNAGLTFSFSATLVDTNDIEQHFPGLIDATRRWFKIYKIPDGKPDNKFAFDGACQNKVRCAHIEKKTIHRGNWHFWQDYALSVVAETHEAWHRLIKGDGSDGISL